MKTMTRGIVLFLLAMCLFNIPTVVAQEATKTDTFLITSFDLEEAMVTSEKRTMRVQDVPSAVSSISSVQIEQQGVESLRELNSIVPNLFMPQYGSKLTAPIYMRGIGARINTPKIGLYVDGIPYFDKSAYDFNLYDIERIEVLRGPQGTLYGRNALGGIIHVITKPLLNSRHTSLTTRFGNYNFQEYRLTHNQPLIDDILVAKVSLDYRKSDGYFQNEFLDRPIDKMDEYSARANVKFTPNDNLEMELKLHAELSNEGGYPYGVIDSETGDLQLPGYDYHSSYQRDLYTANFKLRRSFKPFELTYIAGYQRIDDYQDIDQDFTPADLIHVDQDQVQDLFVQELNLISQNSDKFEWVTGLFGFYQMQNKSVNAYFSETAANMFRLPPGMTLSTKHYDMDNYSLAWFGQGTLKNLFIDKLDLTFGLRTEFENNRMDYQYLITIAGEEIESDAFDRPLDFFNVVPRIAINYNWTEKVNQYFSVSRGFQSGGFNTTFETEQGETFDSEYAWNYEAGMKSRYFNNKVHLDLAVFYIDWDNQQIYQPVPSGRGSKLTNAGQSETKGYEIELTTLPIRNLKASFNFGYTDAKFLDYKRDTANNIDYSGNRIPYIPKYTSQVGVSYRIPMQSRLMQELLVFSSWNTIGKHYWDEENEQVQSPYSLLNGGVKVSFKWAQVSFWANNILDTDYRSFLFDAMGRTYAQRGAPFTWGITLKVDF